MGQILVLQMRGPNIGPHFLRLHFATKKWARFWGHELRLPGRAGLDTVPNNRRHPVSHTATLSHCQLCHSEQPLVWLYLQLNLTRYDSHHCDCPLNKGNERQWMLYRQRVSKLDTDVTQDGYIALHGTGAGRLEIRTYLTRILIVCLHKLLSS